MRPSLISILAGIAIMTTVTSGRADVVTDWNAKAAEIAAAARMPPPSTYRATALVQASVFEAVNAITQRYPPLLTSIEAAPQASIEAAVAAASRSALSSLVPSQQSATDAAYQAALAELPENLSKRNGIVVGEKAAAAVLALRADDGAAASDDYRPVTTAGVYVPTAIPIAMHWGQRKPWLMKSGDAFRPPGPPPLSGDIWTRDYNEIKTLGGKNSTLRTTAQTAIARFWEATMPVIYFPIVRSMADQPGREVTANARLLAVAAMAMDDALIAIFDAKYAYNFWRPITAIRNGDLDGNKATERDADWLPLIDTPMHPEYPCAHCIIASTLGTLLEAIAGATSMPTLHTESPATPGVTHSWSRVGDFVEEVSMARICGGVHYRNSARVGLEMGRKIGELAAEKYMQTK